MKTISRMTFVLLVLVGIAVTLNASETAKVPKEMNGMPLVFSDDFSKGADRWEATDPSTWKVIEDHGVKVYAQTKRTNNYKPPVRSPYHRSLVKNLNVSDFTIETKMKSTTGTYGHRDMCLFFGYRDPSHFYYVHIAPAPKTDPHANSIFIVNGEPRKSIATKRNNGNAWKDDTYHTVRLVRNSKTGLIQVFFDDLSKPIMEAKDTTFKSGRIGVGTFDDTGNIAKIHVWGKKEK